MKGQAGGPRVLLPPSAVEDHDRLPRRGVLALLVADLEVELDAWLRDQPAPPSLTRVLQAALREFLERKKLEALDYRAASAPFEITVSSRGSGQQDTSIEHDAVLDEE